MSGAFDPYYKWLAIPLEEQPPNHYRLLGVTLFEADPDVLDSAAEGRMALLRSRQSGPHAADSQRLLNEVATAQRCLLDPTARSSYDQQLQAALRIAAAPHSAQPVVNPLNAGPRSAGTLNPSPMLNAAPPQTAPPQTAPPQSLPPQSLPPRNLPPGNLSPGNSATPNAPTVPMAQSSTPSTTGLATSASGPKVNAVRRRKRGLAFWLLNPALIGVIVAGILFLTAIYLLFGGDENPDAGNSNSASAANGQIEDQEGKANGGGEEEGSQNADPEAGDVETENGDGTTGTGSIDGGSTTDGPARLSGSNGSKSGGSDTTAEATSSPWTLMEGARVSTSSSDPIEKQPDGSYFVEVANPGVRVYSFEASAAQEIRWLRMEAIPDPRLPSNGPGWNRDGNFVLSGVKLAAMPPGFSQWQPRKLGDASARFSQDRMPPSDTLDGKRQSGWAIYPEIAKRHQLVFSVLEPIKQGTPLRVQLEFQHISKNGCTAHIGRFRISGSDQMKRPPFEVTGLDLKPAVSAKPEDAATGSSQSGALPVAKLAIPTAKKIAEARSAVRQVLPAPKSTADDELLTWTRALIAAASESEDVAEKYALLNEALAGAHLAGDARVGFDIVDRLAAQFDIDILDERAETVASIAERADSQERLDSLLAATLGLCNDLIYAHRFERAADLLDTVYGQFQKEGSSVHEDAVAEFRKYARRLVRAETLMKQAKQTLAKDPQDAAAHATLGAWNAIYMKDIDAGLAHYAKSSDSQWKKLAETETQQASDPQKVGDFWWDVGIRKEKETKTTMLRRAGYWYRKALPKANAKAKAQLNQRLAAINVLPAFDALKREGRSIVIGEQINALGLVDMKLDALAGSWMRRHETLLPADVAADARIRLPLDVPGSYILSVDFTAVDGRSVLLALPAAGRGYQVVLGVDPAGRQGGIQSIAGKLVPKSGVAAPLRIAPGRRHRLFVRFVRNGTSGRIDVRLDRSPYLTWQGDLTALDDVDQKRGAVNGIALGSMDGRLVMFHAAQLQLLGGKAEFLRDEDPFRLSD